MKLPRWAIEHHHFTTVAVLLLLTLGVTSFLTMPRSEDPQFEVANTRIVAVLPGASPKDMEALVVDPLEEELKELDDLDRLESTIHDGLAVTVVEFLPGTDPSDSYDEVVDAVEQVRPDLPPELRLLEAVESAVSDVVIFQVALVSETAPWRDLQHLAESLEEEVEAVAGVKSASVWGHPEPEVRIEVDPDRLQATGIPLGRVLEAVEAEGRNVPGGSVELGERRFTVRSSGDFESVQAIRRVVVAGSGEQLVRLGDIATVRFAEKEHTHRTRSQGERGVFVTVLQRKGTNIFRVRKGLQGPVDALSARLPRGIELRTVFDQSISVERRVGGFFTNLFQGMLLVGAIILVALGGRASVVVITVIPVSIAIAIGWLDGVDYGLQKISIVGLVIALGLLVDNAIVVTENVARRMKEGMEGSEAAVRGTGEVGWAVVAATLTSVLAFLPIVLVESPTADFIRSLPVTVILALLASLAVSLTLTPYLASRLLKGGDGSTEGPLQRALDRVVEGPYRRALATVLRRPFVVLGVAVLAFVGAVSLFPLVGVSFFPKAEKPVFLVDVETPEGTSLDRTDSVVAEMERRLMARDEVVRVATNVGRDNPRVYYNVVPRRESPTVGQILVETRSVDDVQPLVDDMKAEVAGLPGVDVDFVVFENGPPVEAPIAIKVIGPELEVLDTLSREVEAFIAATPGTENIENPQAEPRTDLRVRIDRARAGMLGVPVAEIDRTVRAGLAGLPVSRYRDRWGEELDVTVRMPFRDGVDRPGRSELDRIAVASRNGALTPLSRVATFEFESAPTRIDHFDTRRAATVTAEVRTADGFSEVEVTREVVRRLDEVEWPAGYEYFVGGTLEAQEDSFASLGTAFVLALLAIMAVLVLQFRSYRQPLIIFVAIPFSVIGAFPALLLTGYSFSFTAFIGFTSLVGIVVNNSIILVDYANQLLAEGRTLARAVRESAETRFSPIVLTTLTTVGGLLPLTLTDSSLWSPLGWVIIGGLMVSTLLTLFVVPVLYELFTAEAR